MFYHARHAIGGKEKPPDDFSSGGEFGLSLTSLGA